MSVLKANGQVCIYKIKLTSHQSQIKSHPSIKTGGIQQSFSVVFIEYWYRIHLYKIDIFQPLYILYSSLIPLKGDNRHMGLKLAQIILFF